MGYLNRHIHLDFPELAGRERPDDETSQAVIWLMVRNPKLIPGGELIGKGASARRTAEGELIVDVAAAEEAYGGFAKLIVGGNVLDPTVDSDDPPALPMPPSPADLAKYPIDVLNRLGQLLADSNPR